MRGLCALVVVILASATGCKRKAEPPPVEPLQGAFRPESVSAAEDRGRRLFVERCSTCHGVQGRGDGQNSYNLDPRPPDMSVSLAAMPETQRRRIIEEGSAVIGRSPLCPPSGRVLAEDDVDDLLAYLRRIEKAGSDASH